MPSGKNNLWLWLLGGIAVMLLMGKKAYGFVTKSPSVVVPQGSEMTYAADVVAEVWYNHGYQAVMTSGMDGEHKDDSLHYSGLASDWRTKNLPRDVVRGMVDEVRNILGSRYDVLLEYYGTANEHMHVEYDPT